MVQPGVTSDASLHRWRRLPRSPSDVVQPGGFPVTSEQRTAVDLIRVIAVVDELFVAERLVIEVDGYQWHSSRQAFQRDRARQNALVAAG